MIVSFSVVKFNKNSSSRAFFVSCLFGVDEVRRAFLSYSCKDVQALTCKCSAPSTVLLVLSVDFIGLSWDLYFEV